MSVDRRLAGNDVVGDPGVETRDRDHFSELESVHDRRSRLELEERPETPDSALQRAVREPWARSVPTRSVKGQLGDDVPETARVDREVGRLEYDGESRLVHERRTVEQRREGVVLGGELLATEEEERDVARTCSQDRSRARARARLRARPSCRLHPSPWTKPSVDPPGEVVLRGHGVVVRGEDDQREPEPSLGREQEGLVARELGAKPRRNELQEPLANCVLAAAL